MLADFIQPLGNYLYEVFVVRLDGWAVLGFLAQALFSARFLIQWIVSERARRSVIPVAFWWFSIAGGALLFVYSLHRRDPVFIIGQGGGLFIYIRNVMLVLREQRGEPTPV
ncbi:MAG TPA: lipid-A-disaccharide synthase N-terminal domain-containing protein [Xanthobacteraceae bacterium]|jgi:lipid-A-disaccharide synthase-like uncharacterized protein|nr:lipid-A-disaccharide synthase N-terminal domain-containing protein [Xanthobacteraceae bacterium]